VSQQIDGKPDSKIIIFANYRYCVKEIVEVGTGMLGIALL